MIARQGRGRFHLAQAVGYLLRTANPTEQRTRPVVLIWNSAVMSNDSKGGFSGFAWFPRQNCPARGVAAWIFLDFTPDHSLKTGSVLPGVMQHACGVGIFLKRDILRASLFRQCFSNSPHFPQVLRQGLPLSVGIVLAKPSPIGMSPEDITADVRAGI